MPKTLEPHALHLGCPTYTGAYKVVNSVILHHFRNDSGRAVWVGYDHRHRRVVFEGLSQDSAATLV